MSLPQRLRELLSESTEINIVCHNNPDPDCLASALALGRISAAVGIDEQYILYSGDISHQQNRAFVNLLDIDLKAFEPTRVKDRPPDSVLAFVDHSIPGRNNQVPADTPVDIVIDHHPAEGIDARFVDHREELGAAATILTEYVRVLDVDLDTDLATALLFAIRSDTLDFLRGATPAEYAAAGFLHDHADPDLLRQLSTPSITGGTIDAISTAITNRRTNGAVLISHVGRTTERDSLPQAVDYLVRLEGVGRPSSSDSLGTPFSSAPDPPIRGSTSEMSYDAFGDVGNGGGHHDAAGGEIPLGIFSDYTTDDEQLLDIVEQVITARLVAELNLSDEAKESGTA